jgi:hypothetical protein
VENCSNNGASCLLRWLAVDSKEFALGKGNLGQPLSKIEINELTGLLRTEGIDVSKGFLKVEKADLNGDTLIDHMFVLDTGNNDDPDWGPLGFLIGAKQSHPLLVFNRSDDNFVHRAFAIVSYAKGEKPLIYFRSCRPGSDACSTALYKYNQELEMEQLLE